MIHWTPSWSEFVNYIRRALATCSCPNHQSKPIHQPKLFKADTISSPCYQPDIPATVMGIIRATYNNQTFGINISSEVKKLKKSL